MSATYDFTIDDVGQPETYTVHGSCRSIRVVEKDRTAAALANFNVYLPDISHSARAYLGGEEAFISGGPWIGGMDKPFQAETVLGFGPRVFTVVEE